MVLFGAPQLIISDHDQLWTYFWCHLMAQMGKLSYDIIISSPSGWAQQRHQQDGGEDIADVHIKKAG